MNINERLSQLRRLFSYDRRVSLDDNGLELLPFRFREKAESREFDPIRRVIPSPSFCDATDNDIPENKEFSYVVFSPQPGAKSDGAIIMLHGLNEATWDKYLTWAERICTQTGKPVILFPIAFHMNRAPGAWRNPRAMMPWSKARRERLEGDDTCTFANAALSIRISMQPLRFYMSGLETVYNVRQLAAEIVSGQHPLFREGATIDFFSYSIGALLSQVILMSDPGRLFGGSKLFMFCGGSLVGMMNGRSRDILDTAASDRLVDFYTHDFLECPHWMISEENSRTETAFKSLIDTSYGKESRESFFEREKGRIRAVSLRKDTVIPTTGIRAALGTSASDILEELDFPFPYSHQLPFPMQGAVDEKEVNTAFDEVFFRALAFL